MSTSSGRQRSGRSGAGSRRASPDGPDGGRRAGLAARDSLALGDGSDAREGSDVAVSRFVERFAAVMVQSGLPRMPARVFATLLATDTGRLTAAERAERLQVSPAAISGAVRWLSQFNIVSREHEPGSRRDHYRVDNDVWYEVSIRRDQNLARWAACAKEGVEVLGPDTPAGRRMRETLDFFEFVQSELPAMFERWRRHRSTGRPQTR